MKFKIKTDLYNAIINASIITIIVIGIIVRYYFAKHQIGYCGDDVALLSNVMKYSYLDLCIKPYFYGQCIAPLSAILLKFLYSKFGIDDFIPLGGEVFYVHVSH